MAGAALEASGNVDGALAEYIAALDLAPDFAAAHYNAARLYSQTGDLDRCAWHLEEAVSLAPQLREEAADDANLGWVMKLRRLQWSWQRTGEGNG